jgi:hypothetical protein
VFWDRNPFSPSNSASLVKVSKILKYCETSDVLVNGNDHLSEHWFLRRKTFT